MGERTGARLSAAASRAKETGVALDVYEIGSSRAGAKMFGVKAGRASAAAVSIVAGAHSDEPVGPMTAMALVEWFAEGSQDARKLLEEVHFFICPQINPDGAQRNSVWFDDPLDPVRYLENVFREQPGDDVEFGYPSSTQKALRPENEAIANFLRAGAPFLFHTSLHGMAFSEGAHFLINREWGARTGTLQLALLGLAREAGLSNVHDIDRHGEKGFFRIARGIGSTPVSTAMKAHFLAQDQPRTAELFHPSSMEYVTGLGGDPLCIVTELPLFVINNAPPLPDPPPDETPYTSLRHELTNLRQTQSQAEGEPIRDLVSKYDLRPFSLANQIWLQGQTIFHALEFLGNPR